jgi:hypothetical protein
MSRVSDATVAWPEATAFECRHLTNETRPAYSVHLKTGQLFERPWRTWGGFFSALGKY